MPRSAAVLVVVFLAACSSGDAQAGAAPSAEATAAPAAQQGLTVRGMNGYYDLGAYVIMGEIVNESGAPVYDVEVDLDLLDAAGTLLATEHGAAMLTRIGPGESAPILDTSYGAPEGIARIQPRVTAALRTSRLAYHPLQVDGVETRNGISGVVVTGRARHAASAALNAAKLVAWFRDGEGKVTGVFFDYPTTSSWVPGRTIDFEIETIDETLAGHQAVVRGEGNTGPAR